MRVLALDIGEKRIGVAVSDPSGMVATPVMVLDATRALADGADVSRLVKEYEASVVVVGLPVSLDGTEGPQAQRVRKAGSRLEGFLDTPVVFVDERLSSTQASRAMAATGTSSRQRRGSVDMVAASIFLQSYLDARRQGERIGES
jgi:putative holliday junction resolvase